MFTEEEFQKLIEAMKNGVYAKHNGDFYVLNYETNQYEYCILGLAACVNGKHKDYYYDLNWLLAEKLVVENDLLNDKDWTRMIQFLLDHKEEFVTNESN